jgi:succinate-acetate transporter protein
MKWQLAADMSSSRLSLCRSYGSFWMSLAIYTTLTSSGVFEPSPTKGDRLMLTLWGILVSDACPVAAAA